MSVQKVIQATAFTPSKELNTILSELKNKILQGSYFIFRGRVDTLGRICGHKYQYIKGKYPFMCKDLTTDSDELVDFYLDSQDSCYELTGCSDVYDELNMLLQNK